MSSRRASGIVVAVVLAGLSRVFADSTASKNNEANRLYNQKRYDEALKMYMDAQASRPGAPELHYNIGNVLYRKGEFDKAMEEYRRVQTTADPALGQAAAYNRGNALLMQGRPQEAVRAYVEALRARPDDRDAKRNLELALRLMQQQKQQQAGASQDQQDKNEKPENANQPQSPSSAESGRPRQAQPQSAEMTEEEARQVLEALREEEKEGIRKHARASIPETRKPEKDW
jgi:Ca-activated chloride channel homolog